MTVRPERPQGLGRGLASLIPQRSPGQPVTDRDPDRRGSSPNPHQPRKRFDPEGAGVADREHRRARRPPADPRHRDDRRLPARRRRAPPSRRPGGRPRADPGGRPPARRPRAARARARREPPARGSRSARDGRRVPPAHRGVRVQPGRGRDARRPGPLDGRQHASPARPGARRPGRRRRRPAQRGPRPGARGSCPGAAGPRPRLGRSVRSCRSARPRSSSGGCASRSPSRPARAARRADPDLERVEEDLRRALGTKVSLARSRRGGRIVIEYYSDEELGRLYERLTGGTA